MDAYECLYDDFSLLLVYKYLLGCNLIKLWYCELMNYGIASLFICLIKRFVIVLTFIEQGLDVWTSVGPILNVKKWHEYKR